MNKLIIVTLISALTFAVLPGCVSSRSGKKYDRNQALTAQTVEWGTVRHVVAVEIEGSRSGTGAAIGGAAGGVAGSTAGSGSERTLFAIAGALVGGLIGAFTEEAISGANGLELTVELESGKNIVVVQEQEKDETFLVGDRVRIVRAPDGATRVRP